MRGTDWWRAGQRRKCLKGQEGSWVARGARNLSKYEGYSTRSCVCVGKLIDAQKRGAPP